MNEITLLHRQAMDVASRADIARRSGGQAAELFAEAFELEKRAALLLVGEDGPEPSRSVLLRSAAALGLECGKFREAEQLIAVGLSGNPPAEIAEELRDLFQDATFFRHLDLRGLELDPTELQVSIAGPEVGHGHARSEDVVSRIEHLSKLLHRTAERKRNRPYREGGPPPKAVREDVEVLVSTPRAASFAVSLKIGRPKEQASLFGDESPAIVDEVLACLEALSAGDSDTLRRRIPDPAYFRNFVGLGRQLMPDGQSVGLVGLTSVRNGEERRVALTTPRDELPPIELPPATVSPGRRVTLVGHLRFADATHQSEPQTIKVVEDSGRAQRVLVPAGMMADIVRPLWEQRVTVTGTLHNRVVTLEDIRAADSDGEGTRL